MDSCDRNAVNVTDSWAELLASTVVPLSVEVDVPEAVPSVLLVSLAPVSVLVDVLICFMSCASRLLLDRFTERDIC